MLGFWSGVEDSYIRERLYLTWEYDSELYIEARDWPTSIEQGHWQAREDFYNSKFCICPGGPQLDGFIAFAIHYGCIPGDRSVLLSSLLSSYVDFLNLQLDGFMWISLQLSYLTTMIYHSTTFLIGRNSL